MGLHPERDLLRRFVGEDHPAVGRDRLAEHEASLLLLGGCSDLDRELVGASLGMDRQWHFAKSGLRLIGELRLGSRHRSRRALLRRGLGNGILRRGVRAAGNQRNGCGC